MDGLDAVLALIPAEDRASIGLVVRRLPGERRETPGSIQLDPVQGVIGDRWSLSATPNPEAMVTLMRWDVAQFVADRARVAPAILGDNLFASIDTSAANLPAGTIVRVGTARCEVTAKPHTGCSKFTARVGADVLALTQKYKERQLRGVHLRVLEAGEVAIGDDLVIESRPG